MATKPYLDLKALIAQKKAQAEGRLPDIGPSPGLEQEQPETLKPKQESPSPEALASSLIFKHGEQATAKAWEEAEASGLPEALYVAETVKSLQAQAFPKVKRSLKEILEEKRQAKEALALASEPLESLSQPFIKQTVAQATEAEQSEGTVDATLASKQESFSLSVVLNEKQVEAQDMAMAGLSFCLIGPAGCGKTTTQRSVAEKLLQDSKLQSTSFKPQGSPERISAPSIAFVAYTRRAAANLERAVHKLPELEEALRYNIMTVHALLEYQPVFFWDEEKQKDTMRFEPQRHRGNPLTITHLVIEEASMLGLDLAEKLYDALPDGVQIIFIGDINQLPPVFGPSILNYALMQLPVVELTQVYRQADDSSIITNAHHILKGEALEPADDFCIIEGKSQVQVGQTKMALALAKMFQTWEASGLYDPEQDMILSPFNKQDLGTKALNNWIAQFLGDKRQAVVYEVVAGFTKLYLAVGDRVMFNKRDALITKIVTNTSYMGQATQLPSHNLTRFGVYRGEIEDHLDEGPTLSYQDFTLKVLEDDAERVKAASHAVTIEYLDGGSEELTGAGDFAEQVFTLGYALTVHKAQGCEWRHVFFIQHKDHGIMNYRELIYTAVTRARKKLFWIAKRGFIEKGIASPRIKGNSLEAKLEFFNANLDMSQNFSVVK